MPKKRNSSKTYGQKIISLFAHMMFTGKKRSLSELAQMLDCSKQTVLRLIDDITLSYSVKIEESYHGRQKYFRIERPKTILPVNLSETELGVLQMCHAFAKHLLGKQLFNEATTAIEKSRSQLPPKCNPSSKHFASIIPGSIDYTEYHQIILDLISAMEDRQICKIKYKSISESKAKLFYIKPLKIFSHKDTMYLHAKMAIFPGRPYKEPEFDPLLAVHRIEAIEETDTHYEFPGDYNFEKAFNQHFGVIQGKAFQVTVEFSGWAADYVAERIWSPDQSITHTEDGKIVLMFTSSSEPEIISWVLSFGVEVKVLQPILLAEKIKKNISDMQLIYK
ncbi:hypothetical protein DO021_15515 [Desulfobacter hydrogenophilus]|uniref:WYL domain-containing protein n=1 Tax=Desulfobacter hydrogenophilus TaxID=2291 RepID=A0A328F8T1_9BACT|nr:WYL domain-containing protein [Desulfobacter hydrogenophilus]NDY73090.1 WYL domain-containing protein [Desulfobacter hydrogenophilus]QBH13561.1 WYL domain-containing protein [Desulfobacter hydrogenophilus]RAM01094.1 hypothetical protein DO021_15515 [Desulfobacter hydrogenophilus]